MRYPLDGRRTGDQAAAELAANGIVFAETEGAERHAFSAFDQSEIGPADPEFVFQHGVAQFIVDADEVKVLIIMPLVMRKRCVPDFVSIHCEGAGHVDSAAVFP